MIANLAPFSARLLAAFGARLPRLFPLLVPLFPRLPLVVARPRFTISARFAGFLQRVATFALRTVTSTLPIRLPRLDSTLRRGFGDVRRPFVDARLVEQRRANLRTLGARVPQSFAALGTA